MADPDSIPESQPSPFIDKKTARLQPLLSSTKSMALPFYLPLPIPLPLQTSALPLPPTIPFPSPIVEEVASFPRIRTHGVETLHTVSTTPLTPPIFYPAGIEGFPGRPRDLRRDASDDAVSPLSSRGSRRSERIEAKRVSEHENEERKDVEYVGSAKDGRDTGENTPAENREENLRKLALRRTTQLKDVPKQQQTSTTSIVDGVDSTPTSANDISNREEGIGKVDTRGGEAGLGTSEREDDEDQEAWYTPNEDASKNFNDIDGEKP